MALKTDRPTLAEDVSLFDHPRGTLVRLNRRRSTFLLGPVETAVLKLCDGTRDLADLKRDAASVMPATSVEQLLLLTESNGILASDEVIVDSRGELTQWRLFSMPLSGLFRPGRGARVAADALYWALPFTGALLTWLLWRHGTAVLTTVLGYRFLDPQAYVVYLVSLLVLGALHESAHAVCIVSLGGRVFEVGMLLNYFVPAFYVDLSGVSLLPDQVGRMKVWLAGLAAQFSVFSLTMTAAVLSRPPDWLLSWLIGFNAVNLALFSLNCLFFLKMDGYFLMEELLGFRFARDTQPRSSSAVLRATVLAVRTFLTVYLPLFLGNAVLGLALNLFHVPRGPVAQILPWLAVAALTITVLRLAWPHLAAAVRLLLGGVRRVARSA